VNRQDWLTRADAVLQAPEFDLFLARLLVSELRTVSTSSEIRTTAGMAQSAIQAAFRFPKNKGQTLMAKHQLAALCQAVKNQDPS
jgi:hypothetical protein